jgi:Protein of unknown function (DUF770).
MKADIDRELKKLLENRSKLQRLTGQVQAQTKLVRELEKALSDLLSGKS